MDQLPALSLALAPACPAFPTLAFRCAEFYSTGCLPATTLRAPRRRGEYDDSFGPGDYGWGTDIVTTTLTTDVTEYYHPEPTTVWTTWGEPITSTPTHGVVWVTVYEGMPSSGSETTVTLNPPEVITYTFYPTTTILDTSTIVQEQTTFATSTLLTTETREVSSTVAVTHSPTPTLASSETFPTTPPPWLTLTTTESTETGDDATSTRTSTSSSAGATASSDARSVCQPGDEDQEEPGLFGLTDEQRLTLFVAGIYSIGITLMWNLWGVRWLFYSFKSFTAFIHESGHVVGLLVSSQPLYRFTIDPNLGGATYTTPGRRLKAPAMYLGQVFSIVFGGAMVFTGFSTLASKYASFVVMALWLPVIGLQRNLLSMLNCAVPLGLLIGTWFIDHARGLRFYNLFIGILSSFYIVWDTMDDFFHRKQNECCVVMLESNTAKPAAVWFMAWLVVSLVVLSGCILGAIALFRQTEYGMYCEGQAFAPT
ncbi:M50 family metallopeptidase [Rhodotorula paludigena]|uniref:M50 family metallopeptidase n=1 Tax=Rhodotorula paludigena TaxID=86838 RepID=UPI0031809853